MDFWDGDLLFIDEQSGPLSAAISDVTCRQFGVSGPRLSHVGIVSTRDDGIFVVESRERVRTTTLEDFLGLGKRACSTTRGWYWARVREPNASLIPEALHWIRQRIGAPYDFTFHSKNATYTCSQLVAEAFKSANGGRALFEERPMYFGDSNDPNDPSWKTWESHFRRLGLQVPEGQPGINPLAIYLSEHVDRLR